MDGIIIMTALPPTKGHVSLIEFASSFTFLHGGRLTVLVLGREKEPIPATLRASWLSGHFSSHKDIEIVGYNADLPQNPWEVDNFWLQWRTKIKDLCEVKDGDFFFASEPYGREMARNLNCRFIPWDFDRDVVKTKATAFRMDPIRNFDSLVDTAQGDFQKVITVFGAESVGKSTLAKTLADQLNGVFVPEWARTYMTEAEHPIVTDEVMEEIANGQAAAEDVAYRIPDRPFVFKDTDLLSTIGYWRIYGKQEPDKLKRLYRSRTADLYIVLKQNVPFVPDSLRFGIDHRESSDEFWIDLLKEYGSKYVVIDSPDFYAREIQAMSASVREFMEANLYGFVRD